MSDGKLKIGCCILSAAFFFACFQQSAFCDAVKNIQVRPFKASDISYTVHLTAAAAKKRVYNFPKDYSLGEILIADSPATRDEDSLRGAAKGTITAPAGKYVSFIPAKNYYKNPAICKTLPADGFDCLWLAAMSLDDAEDGLCDRALAGVGHFKGLIVLSLDKSDATDAGAVHAAELPQLQKITASRASLTGACFKSFGVLKELVWLRLPGNLLEDKNLPYLAALPKLTHLTISHCGISDAGIKGLIGCHKIKYLDAAQNPKITDACIADLLQIKSLQSLNINDTSITPKGILAMKGAAIKNLYLPGSKLTYTDDQMKAFKMALPETTIILNGNAVKKIDAETRTLFAPLH